MNFKNLTLGENPGFVEAAEDARVQIARYLLDRLHEAPAGSARDAVLSGAMAAMAQIVWETQPRAETPDRSLARALEFWDHCGGTYINQFFAEDTMGEMQGGKQ